MLLPLLLNLAESALEPQLGPPGGVTYTAEAASPSAVGFRVTVAPEREQHRVTLSLSDPTYAAGAGVGTQDASTLGPYYNEHIQSGLGVVSFDVLVGGNPNRSPLVVPFTVTGGVEGTHYELPFQSPLIIPAGAASAKLYIDFIAQAQWFAQRDIVITLGSAEAGIPDGQQSYSFYLRPTAAAPVIQWDGSTASGTEEGGAITQTISIPSAVLDDVTVYLELQPGGTAVPSDYSTSSLAPVILAGQTSTSFSVTPIDDPDVEGNETVAFKVANDSRTAQVNLWTFSDDLALTEGPAFGAAMDAGRPTDNEYVDDTVQPIGWSLSPVEAGTTPDTRGTAYRYAVTGLGSGSCKIGKSIAASSADERGNTVGGFDQLIPLAADNTLSVYVRKPSTSYTARYFSLDIYDRITGTHHRGRFTWSGTTPVASAVEGDAVQGVMSGELWDHASEGNDWHRVYITVPATAALGDHSMRYLEAFTAVTGEGAEVNRDKGVEFAWPQFEQGVSSPTPYQRCVGSHWSPWGGGTVGATHTCTFTITNTD